MDRRLNSLEETLLKKRTCNYGGASIRLFFDLVSSFLVPICLHAPRHEFLLASPQDGYSGSAAMRDRIHQLSSDVNDLDQVSK
jgi:hypothetical protein